MLRIMHRVYGPALPAAILIGIGAMGKGGASARRAAPRLVKLARAGCDAALFRFHLGCDQSRRPGRDGARTRDLPPDLSALQTLHARPTLRLIS